MVNEQDVLSELLRAKVLFQARTLAAVIGVPAAGLSGADNPSTSSTTPPSQPGMNRGHGDREFLA